MLNVKNSAVALMLFVAFGASSHAQKVLGQLSLLANQSISLEGFNGFSTYKIDSATIDSNGNFELNFSKADYGVGYLKSIDNKPLFVILSKEDVVLKGQALSYIETLQVIQGQENQWYQQYAKEHPRREQALSAWIYLEKIYAADSLFALKKEPIAAIKAEKQRIKQEDADFINSLPQKSYVSWFLPTRKLVSSVSTIAQYRTNEIPAAIAAFRALDYTDKRLYKSGLYQQSIESHFWLLENSGKSLDSVYIEMQVSIDAMFTHLIKDEDKLNEVTDYLFDLLERHSLFTASEYLAIKVLNEVSCTINNDLAKQLETYRAMKKGNTAPDIEFTAGAVYPSPVFRPKKLSQYTSPYTLVVFGASWCNTCVQEIPKIAQQYNTWVANGVEVLYVSLDQDETAFKNFAAQLPFVSVCDYEKWESQAAQDFYVFGTPSMFLLDTDRKILLRPRSVEQMNAWVDWFLVEGNQIPN